MGHVRPQLQNNVSRRTEVAASQSVGSAVSIRGKWRIVEMPDYEADFPDMMEPAYILFGDAGGEFAFGCVTGAIHGVIDGNSVEFTWSGNDEMDQAGGDGWAELQEDGTLEGQICFHRGDEANFTARPWHNFSTVS
jgi:hypothetical protein